MRCKRDTPVRRLSSLVIDSRSSTDYTPVLCSDCCPGTGQGFLCRPDVLTEGSGHWSRF